jgi:hypothetical protein
MKRAEQRLARLRGGGGRCRRLYIKQACAFDAYFQTEWNLLDCVNYFLLLFAVGMRWYSWSLMPAARDDIARIDRLDPTGHGQYVSLYWVAGLFGASFYLHAFSAILTWIKLFKFLSVFPELSIFTKTVALSRKPLGVFLLVVVVVMGGSAQGFCLAFGTDISGFRNPLQVSANTTPRDR